jgi:hypothetical protein
MVCPECGERLNYDANGHFCAECGWDARSLGSPRHEPEATAWLSTAYLVTSALACGSVLLLSLLDQSEEENFWLVRVAFVALLVALVLGVARHVWHRTPVH